MIKNRLPRGTGIVGLPDVARCHADKPLAVIIWIDSDIGDPSRCKRGADAPEFEPTQYLRCKKGFCFGWCLLLFLCHGVWSHDKECQQCR